MTVCHSIDPLIDLLRSISVSHHRVRDRKHAPRPQSMPQLSAMHQAPPGVAPIRCVPRGRRGIACKWAGAAVRAVSQETEREGRESSQLESRIRDPVVLWSNLGARVFDREESPSYINHCANYLCLSHASVGLPSQSPNTFGTSSPLATHDTRNCTLLSTLCFLSQVASSESLSLSFFRLDHETATCVSLSSYPAQDGTPLLFCALVTL